ncbi:glycosyltransferase family 4 protein [Georgenia faecalis]|uniref:D-inositol 3-phosphate glycosyltransferase n=1 Tax=Georgenia faecalis TaxID=2483799 RepID=A0ABV9DBJ9_9MICO|nr:glycosyltransferase family 4 protein [Georgenia faecalis]
MAQPARRLSVVLATRIFQPEPAAASLRLSALVSELAAAGHRVRVLTTTVPGGEEYVPPPGVEVRRWPVLRDAAGYVRGYVQYLSFDVPLAVRLLLTRRPDVVVVEPPPTTGAVVALVCALRRIPYVYYAADVWSDAVRAAGVAPVVARVLRFVERSVMRGARGVLATSAGVAARLDALGVRSGVVAVGNGIDVETFTPDGPAEAPGAPYLVYTGTASEVHGADVFTRAMGRVLAERPEARLVFVGQGSDVGRMQAQAADYPPGAVEFLPRMPPERTARWIRGAHAALASVLPGDYGFAFPSKVYAAAACGTPVIFAGAGPARELVARGGLGTVTDHDVDAVAAAMIDALGRDMDAADRDRRARWAAENVSASAVARDAVAVVEAAAGR